jgi:hypothetical protein
LPCPFATVTLDLGSLRGEKKKSTHSTLVVSAYNLHNLFVKLFLNKKKLDKINEIYYVLLAFPKHTPSINHFLLMKKKV